MRTKTSVWRWIAGGVSIMLIAGGCAFDQQGKTGVRNADGTFEIGGTTYWNKDPGTPVEDINPDNYYYHRVTVRDHVTYEEYGYYLTHPPGHAKAGETPGTKVWPIISSFKEKAFGAGLSGNTDYGWYTLITHPGGSPEIESTECGSVLITHPGG